MVAPLVVVVIRVWGGLSADLAITSRKKQLG